MTQEQLIKNAEAKGYQVNLEYADMIGIYKGKHVWHWFKIYDTDLILFDHSYSMNTGASKKGLAHRMSVYESLGFYDA